MEIRTCPHLVSLNQCGLELRAPQMRTTTKRRLRRDGLDDAEIRESLLFMAWDAQRVEAVFPDLDPTAAYEIEATYLSERGVARTQTMTAGGIAVHPPVDVPPGAGLTIRSRVPVEAIVHGTLKVRVDRVSGPDAVVSELRLYSSNPAPLTVVAVGDSRGGILGSVSDPSYEGVAGARLLVSGPGVDARAVTDSLGMFHIRSLGLPLGQRATLTLTATAGPLVGRVEIDTRHLARGLRELPEAVDRVSLAGDWVFESGPGARGADGGAVTGGTTRVPGHIAFDGLVPERGVGTLSRVFTVSDSWADSALFLRFDGAYGRAEVFVNGSLAGVHGSGATSFDVDVSRLVQPGDNTVAVTLTEYTPHSVIDYMSWYAHMSLLGIWREVFLFRTEAVHLGQLDLLCDWDRTSETGILAASFDVINLGPDDTGFAIAVEVRQPDGAVLHSSSVSGRCGRENDTKQEFAAELANVRPWSAEDPQLYVLSVQLWAGNAHQSYERRVGFRRVEVVGNELLVNGSAIRILGVNRHDARMTTGRSLTRDQLREDVLTLRHGNVNTIRTSHYPADPRLVELCDELGMYLFDQPPICWLETLGCIRANVSAHLVPYILEVTAETVCRDKGHCSVIVWDTANESDWSKGFEAQLALVGELDPSRPTFFSFDLNQTRVDNLLSPVPDAARPSLLSYHYPGWEQPWQNDLEQFSAHDMPVIFDEYIPIFESCQRDPHETYALTIDPGLRDYWVKAIKPFMRQLNSTRSCIGGMVWSGVDDLFAIPFDLNIGEGPWAHLPQHSFLQLRDSYRSDDKNFFRGDGEWGVIDSWGRPRAESWHLQKMYSPIEVDEPAFDLASARMTVSVLNRFSHRSFRDLTVTVRTDGGEQGFELTAKPGQREEISIDISDPAELVELEFRHPEGWLVDGFSWRSPGKPDQTEALLLSVSEPAELGHAGSSAVGGVLSSAGQTWLTEWPSIHIQSADRPDLPLPSPVPSPEPFEFDALGARGALAGDDWRGQLSAHIEGNRTIFDYECTFLGSEAFNAREVGLAFALPANLTDLWWRRAGEWSYYPVSHIGRNVGYASANPRPRDVLHPTKNWEDDGTPAGSNDYRSAKRDILCAGATDGRRSFSVISSGEQSVRAELQGGRPVLHVLDWYGGVRTLDRVHPVWSDYFGAGQKITPGTLLKGTVTVVLGGLPETVRG